MVLVAQLEAKKERVMSHKGTWLGFVHQNLKWKLASVSSSSWILCEIFGIVRRLVCFHIKQILFLSRRAVGSNQKVFSFEQFVGVKVLTEEQICKNISHETENFTKYYSGKHFS